MISILALVVGLLGMLGLWTLAWQLWMRALAIPPSSASNDWSAAPSSWRNEPSPDVPGVELGEVPAIRDHSNSGANTTFFNRSDLAGLVDAKIEKTEILDDDNILDEPTRAKAKPPMADPPPVTGTRKTKVYPPPAGARS